LGAGRSYLREFYRDDGSPGGQYDIWYYGFNALLARDLLGLAYSPAGLRFEPHFPASWVNARGPAEARLNGKSYAAAIKGFRYGKTLLDLYYDRPAADFHQIRGLSVKGTSIAGPVLPEEALTRERTSVIVHF
jgi:hypothetical protein